MNALTFSSLRKPPYPPYQRYVPEAATPAASKNGWNAATITFVLSIVVQSVLMIVSIVQLAGGKGDRPPADARSEAEGQRRGRPRSCGAEKQVSARTARRRRGRISRPP